MVQRIMQAVADYEDRLRNMQSLPRFSYGRGMVRKDGASNRIFLTYLFGHQQLAIQFLKDVGLIRGQVQCNICDRDMTWSVDPDRPEGFRWRCRKRVAGARCRGTASIRHGSWFQLSNLTLMEVMLLTYDILRRDPAHQIENELCLSDHTVADWGMFCRETMLDFL